MQSNPSSRTLLPLLANILLFASSICLLIELGPTTFSRSYKARAAAVAELRRVVNVFGTLPPGTTAKPETSDLKIVSNPEVFATLRDFIREQSPLSSNVDWTQAVGVGYSTLRIPVGQLTLDAFHPVYAVVMPPAGAPTFALVPVGELSQVERWLTEWRQSSLTTTALVLLTLGFLLQLMDSFTQWRTTDSSDGP